MQRNVVNKQIRWGQIASLLGCVEIGHLGLVLFVVGGASTPVPT